MGNTVFRPKLNMAPGAALALVENAEFGPAMQALRVGKDLRRQAFVVAFFAIGGNANRPGDGPRAAAAAGYAPGKGGVNLSYAAHNLLHHPKVCAAMLEYGRSRFQGMTPALVDEMLSLAMGEGKHKFEALRHSLGLAGLTPVVEIHSKHEVTITYEEKVQELRRLAALAGDDPDRALVGLPAPSEKPLPAPAVTDAEFEEAE